MKSNRVQELKLEREVRNQRILEQWLSIAKVLIIFLLLVLGWSEWVAWT